MYVAPSGPASPTGTESARNKIQPSLLSSTGSSRLPSARLHQLLEDPGPLPAKHPGGWGDALGAEQHGGVRYPLPSCGSGMLPTAIAIPLCPRQMETKTEAAQSTEQRGTQGKPFPTDTSNTSFYILVPGIWLPLSLPKGCSGHKTCFAFLSSRKPYHEILILCPPAAVNSKGSFAPVPVFTVLIFFPSDFSAP